MPLARQAKIISPAQERKALHAVQTHRHPERDAVMVLLSLKAGLRSCEIAALTWGMVTDAEGAIDHTIRLPNVASKGTKGGREIPLNPDLRAALKVLRA